MGSVPPLLSFLLMIAAGWVHRHQLIVIEFLQAEDRLLKERLRGADSVYRRGACPSSAQGQGGRAQSPARTRHDSLAGYPAAVASTVGCAEVGLHPPTRSWPTGHHASYLRIDRAHGRGESELGLYPHSRSVSQSQSQGWSRHDRQCPETQWHRAVAGAGRTNAVVNLSQGPLEGAGCQ